MEFNYHQQFENLSIDILKQNGLKLNYPYDVLRIIHNINVDNFLDESYYNKIEIKKQNGKIRVLHEPKPNLKVIQRKLLEHINFFFTDKNYPLFKNIKLINGVVAYRKNKSVINNANFHIAQEFVLKLDIKDFFGNIKVEKLEEFWFQLLKKSSTDILKSYIFNSEFDDEQLRSLAKKINYITSINGHLPQGGPLSGILANYYMILFDSKLLNHCKTKSFNYSRYSDDITISGKLSDLKMGSLLGAIQFMLKDLGLKLNKSKTKLLKSNTRQIVTGVVVNVHKNAGREYKRTIRQEMYFLKKFREQHIEKKQINKFKYLKQLLGKLSWITHLEKSNLEFNTYKAEAIIFNRFLNSGKTLNEAIDYIKNLHNIHSELSSDKPLVINNIEWKDVDENHSPDLITDGIYNQTKRKLQKQYFDEIGLKNLFPILSDAWRLPTSEEIKDYLKETCYFDRQLLGLRTKKDLSFNGLIYKNRSFYFSKLISYWTADLKYIKENNAENALGRNVYLQFSKGLKSHRLNLSNFDYISKNSGFKAFNKGTKSLYLNQSIAFNLIYLNSSVACSVRLVRNINETKSNINLNYNISDHVWKTISKNKLSSSLNDKDLHEFPKQYLENWSSANLLLSNNNFTKGLDFYPPVLKIDLSKNQLKTFDFNTIPKTVKHLLLHDNPALTVNTLPENFIKQLHELTLPSHINSPFGIESTNLYQVVYNDEKWYYIDSEDQLLDLIQNRVDVEFLKITINPGNNKIDSEQLLQKLECFENLNTLQIVIEPESEFLKNYLDGLKNRGRFIDEDLAFNDTILNKKYESKYENEIYNWLNSSLTFHCKDLKNKKINNLIIDFSWNFNVKFVGDFDLKLERYHLLHPGVLPIDLPATSKEFHQPNLLVKVLGFQSSNAKLAPKINTEVKRFICFIPFIKQYNFFVFNQLEYIYPINQLHIGNLTLVVSNFKDKVLPKGSVKQLFPKSEKFKLQNIAFFEPKIQKNTTFNFPLLGYSENFDVYMLSVPLKHYAIRSNKFIRRYDIITLDKLDKIDSKIVVSLLKLNKYNDNDKSYTFEGDDIVNLNFQNIFPKDRFSIDFINSYTIKPFIKTKQFKIDKSFYSDLKHIKDSNKANVIEIINKGKLHAMHLTSKLKKDFDVMIAAIHQSAFSFVFANKSLLFNEKFVIESIKVNPRILIFLKPDLLLHQKGLSLLNYIYDYLKNTFSPNQFYFIINHLAKKVIVEKKGYIQFKYQAENKLDVNSIIESFEKELLDWKLVRLGEIEMNWYSLNQKLKHFFINKGIEDNFLNSNGYYIDFDKITNEGLYLDFSYDTRWEELLKNSQKTEKLDLIKKINLSFNFPYEKLEELPIFKNCEVLYLDGLFKAETEITSLNLEEKFPNLRVIIYRTVFRLGYSMDFITEVINTFKNIEYLDFRRSIDEFDLKQQIQIADRSVTYLGSYK